MLCDFLLLVWKLCGKYINSPFMIDSLTPFFEGSILQSTFNKQLPLIWIIKKVDVQKKTQRQNLFWLKSEREKSSKFNFQTR